MCIGPLSKLLHPCWGQRWCSWSGQQRLPAEPALDTTGRPKDRFVKHFASSFRLHRYVGFLPVLCPVFGGIRGGRGLPNPALTRAH